jgi:hypothetical protein
VGNATYESAQTIPDQGPLLRLQLCGTAPVEASSGEVVRHRLSLASNRKPNYALHMVAVCQARSDTRGRAYYRRKIAQCWLLDQLPVGINLSLRVNAVGLGVPNSVRSPYSPRSGSCSGASQPFLGGDVVAP